MRRIAGVANSPRRGVGDQHVDSTAVTQPPPPGAAAQGTGAPCLLPIGVLIGPTAVAAAAAESCHPQPGDVDDPAIRVNGAVGPRRAGGHTVAQYQTATRESVAGHVR